MCRPERNTDNRGRPAALIFRWWRTRCWRRARGDLLACGISWSLLLLAFLAEDLLAQIHHALALVGLRLAVAADFSRDLADPLLVRAGDQDRGRLLALDLDVRGDRKIDVVAIAQLQRQGFALHRGAIADAADIQRLAVALRDAGERVAHQVAGRAPHHARLLGTAELLDDNLVVL